MKSVPVNVTLTVVPLNPLDGEIEVNVGVGRPTLNGMGLLVPREVVTVTLSEPAGASAATVRVNVTVSFDIVGLLTLTPEPAIFTVVGLGVQPAPPPTTK